MNDDWDIRLIFIFVLIFQGMILDLEYKTYHEKEVNKQALKICSEIARYQK